MEVISLDKLRSVYNFLAEQEIYSKLYFVANSKYYGFDKVQATEVNVRGFCFIVHFDGYEYDVSCPLSGFRIGSCGSLEEVKPYLEKLLKEQGEKYFLQSVFLAIGLHGLSPKFKKPKYQIS